MGLGLPPMAYGDGIGKRRQVAFLGYSHNLSARDGELWDMKNLTSDYSPLLAPRAPRYHIRTLTKPNGFYAHGGLYWVDGTGFYADGEKKGDVTDSKKQFASLGKYIVILPDKAYYDTQTKELGNIEASWGGENGLSATFDDGTLYGEPAEANTITAADVTWSDYFRVGDGVTISGCTNEMANNKTAVIVEIEGNNEEQLRTFYSNFYRTSLYPRKFYEIDEQGTPHHFSPYNGKINTGYMYTDNGFWDTFRSAHPWLTLIVPSISREIMQSLVNTYNEGGWLPSWASPGYRDSMIGSHAVSLITDAYQKGITDFDAEKAFEAVVKDCFQPAPKKYIGRYGYKEYNEKGYIPYPEYEQATSMSLEYAYDDFCIYRLAELLGKNQDTLDMFKERAKNYIHSFDTTTGFMRPRKADGSWYSPFTPYLWGGPFTEGNSWQYSWSVFHDIQGLINLHGSNEAFVNKMDSLFKVPLNAPLYGRYFNEIAEMHNASFGQYAHGNQPDQHFAYLYNYAGQSWKTQRLVRKIMDRLYNSTPNGYCGDEDNGQTSSWYLFSAIGFYPVCPGTGQYVFGSPLFNTVKLHLENGKTFTVKTFNNKPGNCYIDNIEINGEKYTPLYISHRTITEGTTLFFNMSSRPNKNLKLDKKDLPYSLSNEIKN